MRVLEKAGITAISPSQYLRAAQTAELLTHALGVKINADGDCSGRNLSKQCRNKIPDGYYGYGIQTHGRENTDRGQQQYDSRGIRAQGGDVIPEITGNDYYDLVIFTVYRIKKAESLRLRYGDFGE